MARFLTIAAGGVAVLGTALFFSWLIASPGNQQGRMEITVYAAASLRDVLTEVREHFEPGGRQKVRFNFAGSNVLAQQIVAANQADIFISANDRWIDHVEQHNRSVAGTRRAILSNRLVVIANASTDWTVDQPEALADLPIRYLSIGDPDAVPAGLYSKGFLSRVRAGDSNLWQIFQSKLAPAPDVRSALNLVASDPDILGIVYRTDAMASNLVKIIYEVPHIDGPAIRYFAAMIKRPNASKAAQAFYDFLLTDTALGIFQAHGFLPAGDA